MWSFDQAKIVLILVQELPLKNEAIDLCNEKFGKLSINLFQQILPEKG
jgi:hypothetical protein